MAIFWGYGEKEKSKPVHIESDKDDVDVTQTIVPTDATTTPNSNAPLTEQEHVIHQLIDDLMKLNTAYEDEMSINQLKRKRYKQAVGKSVQAYAGEMERQPATNALPENQPNPVRVT
ncbi:hypothetical protein PVK06_047184 [Gossypium arboreum]|uniref:Uncharacterized protein n=1 Tax=Gossypium arboreum TaxID=29729 RepID=A0ABR0MD34_GOSAR|nr:hypothetical protein PVK06_047184 [Gossypium arboreum]